MVCKISKLSLPLFEFGIFLVYYINTAFPSDYLAVGTPFLYRRSYFHNMYYFYLYLNVILPFVRS